MRPWLTLPPMGVLGVVASLTGCAPSYSPNTYASSAVQQANKVERGLIVGVRPVDVSSAGVVGATTGAAAGGALGAQAPGGSVTSTLGAVGGALIGGLVGVGAEKTVANTDPATDEAPASLPVVVPTPQAPAILPPITQDALPPVVQPDVAKVPDASPITLVPSAAPQLPAAAPQLPATVP